MNALIEEVNDPDFVVIGVPSNNFGLQEPGGNSEIRNGIRAVRPGNGYEPKFDLTTKQDVNGNEEHPLFTFLKNGCPNPTLRLGNPDTLYWTPIKQTDFIWNFEKVLINRAGAAVSRHTPAVNPASLVENVRALLAESPNNTAIKPLESNEIIRGPRGYMPKH